MLAIVNTPGGPEPIAIREVAKPEPQPNEALVAVHAFSLNRGELRLFQVRPEGWRPGQDIAGVVVRAAADGTGPAAGTSTGFAQTGSPAPHRLTSDGRTEPVAWDLAGILVARPGAGVRVGDQSRVANELWQIDPSTGAGRLLTSDGTVPARRSTAPAGWRNLASR